MQSTSTYLIDQSAFIPDCSANDWIICCLKTGSTIVSLTEGPMAGATTDSSAAGAGSTPLKALFNCSVVALEMWSCSLTMQNPPLACGTMMKTLWNQRRGELRSARSRNIPVTEACIKCAWESDWAQWTFSVTWSTKTYRKDWNINDERCRVVRSSR